MRGLPDDWPGRTSWVRPVGSEAQAAVARTRSGRRGWESWPLRWAAAMMRAKLGTYCWVESSPFIPLEKLKSLVQWFVSESTHVARKGGKQK